MVAGDTPTRTEAGHPEDALAWLLPTKLTIPPPRHHVVARPQLFNRLAQAVTVPLTSLVAPAGFGKTTLLATWRTTPSGSTLPLAWVSLDEGDNDPARFWSYSEPSIQASARPLSWPFALQSPRPASIS
jgi:LuxR family maltose regulon positive regulatory protein